MQNSQSSEMRREKMRRILDSHPNTKSGVLTRIGYILRPSEIEQPDQKRFRFGLSLIILSVFIMVLCAALPGGINRWLIFGFAWLTLFIGAWQVDLSRKK